MTAPTPPSERAGAPEQALPSTESFLAEFGIAATGSRTSQPASVARSQVAAAVAQTGVSREFAALLIQYCATMVSAHELGQVHWGGLAKRLGTLPEYLAEAAEQLNQQGGLWTEVLQERIKRASASKVFRDSSWERLEALAVNRLIVLAESNMIRDPGELLAVAAQARRANTDSKPGQGGGGTTVNINMNGDSMDNDTGLPAAGAKMTIDLSPRVAGTLGQRATDRSGSNRVIDGQMLSATELRAALLAQKGASDADSAEETEDSQGIFDENR